MRIEIALLVNVLHAIKSLLLSTSHGHSDTDEYINHLILCHVGVLLTKPRDVC